MDGAEWDLRKSTIIVCEARKATCPANVQLMNEIELGLRWFIQQYLHMYDINSLRMHANPSVGHSTINSIQDYNVQPIQSVYIKMGKVCLSLLTFTIINYICPYFSHTASTSAGLLGSSSGLMQ